MYRKREREVNAAKIEWRETTKKIIGGVTIGRKKKGKEKSNFSFGMRQRAIRMRREIECNFSLKGRGK